MRATTWIFISSFCAATGLAGCGYTTTTANTPPQNGKLAITTTSLAGGQVGVAYSGSISASGGMTPYTFSAGSLPSGLTIAGASGAISGTPAQGSAGTSTIDFTVTDSSTPMQTATASLSLTLTPAKLTITTTALQSGTVGSAYSGSVSASGGTTPYTFTAANLPGGLSMDAGGAITGTPGASAAGTASVAVTVTDSTRPAALTASANLSLTIDPEISPSACGGMSTGDNASLNGFVPFPAGSLWNTDVSSAPLDPNNTAITTAAGFAGLHLHHDFSSVAGGDYGIPYVVVDSSATPLVPINVIDYASQSDVADAPFPITAPIEGAPADCDGWPDTYVGDSHVLVLDRNTCFLYETFNTHRCNGQWNSSSETIWDMQNDEMRPWGWTSADAAGLPIFAGLVRYDEVAAGAINHAIRFTMQQTKNDANGGYFVEPGTHAAGTVWGVSNVMGMRIRLKADFDISGYSQANQVILTAMKKYGMIVADNGGYFFFQGAPDPRWDDNDLENLDSIQSSNFEVVQMTPAWPGWDANTAPTGNPPTIVSFTASPSTASAGAQVTLSWDTANDSYDFIDVLGGVHGGKVVVTPSATTTYTLNATNQYGRSTKAVTVTVQ
jgi:putative Ig domain-containing protein